MPKIDRTKKVVATQTAEPVKAAAKKPYDETTQVVPTAETPAAAQTTTAVAVKGKFANTSLVSPTAPVITAPSTGDKLPWLRFYSTRSKNAADVKRQIKTIDEGEAYLALPDEDGNTSYHAVSDFFLVDAREYYTEVKLVGSDYKLLRAATSKPEDDDALQREIVATVLVVLDDAVVPAVASFRGAKAPAAQTMVAAVQESRDWRAVVGAFNYSLRTSKRNGFNYVTARADVRPIDAKQAKLLNAWFNDETSQEQADQVHEGWRNKCREIECVAAGENESAA